MNQYGNSPKYPKRIQTTGQSNISSISSYDSDKGKWKCVRCGCSTNNDDSHYCKECNAPRYSIETISEDEKKVIEEYIEKQLSSQSFEDIFALQNRYFGTSSLAYMTCIVPNAKDFTDLDVYKTKLKESTELKQIAATTDDTMAQLQKIKELFEADLIDGEEYKSKKAQILGI